MCCRTRFLALVVFVAILLLSGCRDERGVMENALSPLVIPTYDGSGQATEPSIVYFPNGWSGFKYWLVVAPYPYSNAKYENPSVLVSDDGTDWSTPPGVSNPLEKPPLGGHLDDSTLFYDQASDELWLFFLEQTKSSFAILLRTVSKDGVHWSKAESLIEARNYELVMPTVTKSGDRYWMWSVDAGGKGCSASSTALRYRTSSDGEHWSAPKSVNVTQSGYKVWHISVAVLPSLPFRKAGLLSQPVQQDSIFVMLASAFRDGCGHDRLFLAYSTSGVFWKTFSTPLLAPNEDGWDNSGIYQSTLVFDPASDLLRVWYSADGSSLWHIGLTQGDFVTVLEDLIGTAPSEPPNRGIGESYLQEAFPSLSLRKPSLNRSSTILRF